VSRPELPDHTADVGCRPNPRSTKLSTALLGLATLIAVGSFGTRTTLQTHYSNTNALINYIYSSVKLAASEPGIVRWGGFDWTLLAVAVLIGLVVMFTVLTGSRISRLIAAALLAPVLMLTSVFVVTDLLWPPPRTLLR